MKNLKKVLALVVVFSMMLGTVAFAAFPDVAEDADYANAVDTLAALGIVSGDDQGNFNPDNTITRAEFTKMVCEMQGIKGDASKGATIFTDVAADHWASGYINMATGMGIINGMGDGTFAPSSPVTYEQAIKMIVVALGYEPMAADRGGYPTGYLAAAQASGLTKGIKAPAQADAAIRSLIAELVCNALDVPMMQQTGFGSDKKFEVMDGNPDSEERITLLSSKFDVVKVSGVVVATEFDAIESAGKAAEGEVKIKFDNNFKSTNEDFDISADPFCKTISAEIGETNAADFFGKRVIAFIAEEGRNDYAVIAIVEEDGKNETLEISGADIDEIVVSGDPDVIKYWESEDARRPEEIEVKEGASVIWNGCVNVVGHAINDLNNDVLNITFVDWDANGVYDLIIVEEYANFVVDEIDADIYSLTSLAGDELVLDPDDDYVITIVDAKGNKVDFADIKEGDVLAVITDDIGGFDGADFKNVTVLGESKVEGLVRAAGDGKYTIGDEVYEVDANAYNKTKVKLGAEGTFYIGIAGTIVAFDGTTAAAGNYAIILDVEAGATNWNATQVKVLNKDGEVVIYDLADEVKVKNNAGTDSKFAADEAIADTYFDGTAWAWDGADKTLEEILDGINGSKTPADADIIKNFVQIKVNADNEIYEIAPASANTFSEHDYATKEYRASSMRFGDYGKFDNNTVIFSINDNDIEKSKIITTSALVDEATYTLAGFDKESGVYGAAIILDGGNSLSGSVAGMAVVTSKSITTDADGVDAVALTVVADGSDEAKDVLVTIDTLVDNDYNASTDARDLAGDMTVGSLLLYTADDAGVATIIASIADIENGAYSFNLKNGVDATYGKTTFMYGVTNGEFTNTLDTTDGVIDITSATNKYRYNNATSKAKVVVGNFKGGNVVTPKNGVGNLVFARLVDGDVIDLISIDKQVNIVDVNFFADAADANAKVGKSDSEDNTIVVQYSEDLLVDEYLYLQIKKGSEVAGIWFQPPTGSEFAYCSFENAGAWEVPGTLVTGSAPAAGDYTVTFYAVKEGTVYAASAPAADKLIKLYEGTITIE